MAPQGERARQSDNAAAHDSHRVAPRIDAADQLWNSGRIVLRDERVTLERATHVTAIGSFSASGDSPRCQGQRAKPAETHARAAHCFAPQAQARKAVDDALYCELTFKSRNGHPRAGVAAGRERQVRIRSASDVEPVRLRKYLRIAVGSTYAQM